MAKALSLLLTLLLLLPWAAAKEDGGLSRLLAEGDALHEAGKSDAALELYRRAAARARQAKDVELEIQARLRICIVHDDAMAYVELRDETERMLELEETSGSPPPHIAMSLADLGAQEIMLGNGARAVELLERARRIAGDEGDADLQAAVRARLGRAYLETGRLAAGLRNAVAAVAHFRAAKDPASLAEALTVEGSAYADAGDYDAAAAAFQAALAAAPKDLAGLRADLVANLGTVLYEQGKFDEAMKRYDAAGGEFAAAGDKSALAMLAMQMGKLHLRAGRPGAALVQFTRIDASEPLTRVAGARAKVYAGHAYLGLEKPAQARAAFTAALAAGLQVANIQVQASAHAGLAHLALDAREPQKVVEHVDAALDLIDVTISGLDPLTMSIGRGEAHRTTVFDLGIAAAMQLADDALLHRMIERGRAGALRAHARLVTRGRDELYRRKEAVRAADRRYAEASRRGDIDKLRAAGDAVARAHTDLRLMLAQPHDATSAGQGRTGRVESLTGVRAALRAGEVLVQYALSGPRAVALVVAPQAVRRVDLGAGPAVRKAVFEADPQRDDESLRTLLTGGLRLDASARHVFVSPDAGLSQLPPRLLFPKRAASFVPSGTFLADLRRHPSEAGIGVLALGNPDYSRPFEEHARRIYVGGRALEPLPRTAEEVRAFADAKTDRGLLGKEATEAAFRHYVGNRRRWNVLVFACHGFAHLRQPGRSALVLTPEGSDDGFLTLAELLNMELPADLAVLSACDTARSPVTSHEGPIGLPYAFLMGGTPRVLASLWRVDDQATSALMRAFYEHWRAGEGAAVALRKAQDVIRQEPRWKDRKYWAAWVLWGLPEVP